MTLALLLTAVTGAWASGEIVVTVTAEDLQADQSNPFTKDGVTIKCSDRMSGGVSFNELNEMSTTLGSFTKIEITNQFPEGISGINGINGFTVNGSVATWTGKASSVGLGHYSVGPVVQFVFTIEPAEPAIDVKWDAATKTGSFVMPAFDVEIAPIYAPVAQWAKVENVDQLPTAIEGIIAGEAKDIVKAGTVATTKIGEADPIAQGTVMYAVTTENKKPTSTTGFNATVPTGAALTGSFAEDQTVYVWYYIKGIDAAEGVTPTEENTFNDSEICETPLTVKLKANQFTLTLNPAPVKNMTVTVSGQAKTPTDEGKVEAVKMGSEVKVKANTGYKFRKVEVKKKEALPALNITSPEVGQVIGSDGKNYAYGSLPTGVTAVAKICYVSGSNGLALALTDEEGKMNWSTAIETCAAHTPAFTGGTWKLASKDEWSNMISAAGSYTNLRNGFSSVGGTNMQEDTYWSSTERDSDDSQAWVYFFNFIGNWSFGNKEANAGYVRPCLAF